MMTPRANLMLAVLAFCCPLFSSVRARQAVQTPAHTYREACSCTGKEERVIYRLEGDKKTAAPKPGKPVERGVAGVRRPGRNACMCGYQLWVSRAGEYEAHGAWRSVTDRQTGPGSPRGVVSPVASWTGSQAHHDSHCCCCCVPTGKTPSSTAERRDHHQK